MVKEGNSSLKIVIYLLSGIILSGIVSAMCLTKSINIERFYDVGNIYDIPSSDYRASGENWKYNYSTKLIEIEAENARHSFDLGGRQKQWNYLYLELKELSKDVQCEVEVMDGDGNILYTMCHKLQDGCNILKLHEGQIHRFYLVVKEPCSFRIQRIQLRERLRTFGWKEGLTTFGIVCFGYLFIMLGFLFLKRDSQTKGLADEQRGGWMQKVQDFYCCLLYRAVELRRGFSDVNISQMRRALFLLSMVISHLILVLGGKSNVLLQRRMVFLLGLCLLFIAILSVEKRGRVVNWKNPLMNAWMVLWSMSIISEFVVGKNIQNIGIFMLGCMAPLYMAWGSMKNPERLLKDFLIAMRWSYWISFCYCVFFRPYISGVRYVGIYGNANTFAGYLVTVNMAFLIWLDDNLNNKMIKNGTICKNVLAILSLCGFLILTESVTSTVVYLMEWVIFLWKQFPNDKTEIYWRNLRKFVVAFVIAAVFTGILGKWCLNNVPYLLKTAVVLEGDTYIAQEHPLSMTVNAASGLMERVLQKLQGGDVDMLFASRTDIWRNYIRQLNLFGHKGFVESFGNKRWHAHNTLLQVMHYYGVFAAVPYLVMLYYSVKYAIIIIFSRRRRGMNLFFLMAVGHYIVRGFTEDMITPYLYIGWLAYFIALGGLANQPERKGIRG